MKLYIDRYEIGFEIWEVTVGAGRPRSFCVEDAIDRAMTVFWRKGYEGASMADLTDAMGINPPSLYACFGNKEGLFRAVVDRYLERGAAFMKDVLAAPTAEAVAAAYLHGVAALVVAPDDNNPPGCLLLQTGLSGADPDIPDRLAQHRIGKEIALKARFEAAQRQGDLSVDADPAALARYLTTIANGMAVQAASGATVVQLHEVADFALSAWPRNGTLSGTARAKSPPADATAV
jgi:AcrR family transcriptional regulator